MEATENKPVRTGDDGLWVAVVPALDRRTCDGIVNACQMVEARVPRVVGQESMEDQRVGVARCVERSSATEDLYELLWRMGTSLNRQFFDLALTGILKPPEYLEYPSGRGHFHWHNDYGLERPTSRRKLTVSVQLSDPDDYEGGDLEVFGATIPLPKTRGSVVALPSYVHHRVTPVTAGVRRALVGWLAGPALR